MIQINIVKSTWNIVVWIIFIIALMFAILFFVPRIFKVYPYIVTSGSMEPKYKVNSVIYVKKVAPEQVKVGDAISFYLSNDIVATHEVYKIDKKGKLFYTRGINNKDQDGNILNDANPVSFDKLVGKPIYTIPHLGAVNKFVTEKPNRYYFIGVIVFSLLVEILLERKD